MFNNLDKKSGGDDMMLVGAINPFLTKGQWYKGNLHTHTTNSDGRLSLEQIISSYKGRGYDFLGITDHEKVNDIDEHSTVNPLLIRGIEIICGCSKIGEPYHILGIGLKKTVKLPDDVSAQKVINMIRVQQGIIIIAHPYWSGLTFGDVLPLKGILGIEVFNTHCRNGIGKGFSAVHWDDLLARGKNLYGFASDDTHCQEDIGQGWIMVKAKSLSVTNILVAIKKGQFYSTCGPIIRDIVFKDNIVAVRCSEAAVINFVCDSFRGKSFHSKDGKLMTSASYDLLGQEAYLRIEVIDVNGKPAWSQPLFYKGTRTV